mmetsp:Transcript_106076/g.253192  ORF Transcript_106076/g.253192 Transcript_106076/m.253192 type:complete len:226 (-) Transcript_106076:3129-3806(-)
MSTATTRPRSEAAPENGPTRSTSTTRTARFAPSARTNRSLGVCTWCSTANSRQQQLLRHRHLSPSTATWTCQWIGLPRSGPTAAPTRSWAATRWVRKSRIAMARKSTGSPARTQPAATRACPWTASLATGARGRRSRASSAADYVTVGVALLVRTTIVASLVVAKPSTQRRLCRQSARATSPWIASSPTGATGLATALASMNSCSVAGRFCTIPTAPCGCSVMVL